MEIIKLKIKDLKKYSKNAKVHTYDQIEQIKKSIEQFGMNDPIAVWGKDNLIVEGHGRLEALKELGYEEVECIRLDHLSEEERKAYTLVHNKLTMNTDFDFEMLLKELDEIDNIDMEDFGFDFDIEEEFDEESEEKEEEKVNERHRTDDAYNLILFDAEYCDGKYQMPIIENDNYIPSDLIGFNYAKSSDEKNKGIHFFLDDYQFERVWNSPEDYVDILSEYDCMFSPDFSLYMDMPYAMKVWNVYRSRLIGQYYQQQGIKVIPTISWAEEETFEFCFDGIPEGSIVAISTIGVKRNEDAFKVWKNGMDAMINKIKPSAILVYGGVVEYDYKDIKVVYFNNEVTERMKGKED